MTCCNDPMGGRRKKKECMRAVQEQMQKNAVQSLISTALFTAALGIFMNQNE